MPRARTPLIALLLVGLFAGLFFMKGPTLVPKGQGGQTPTKADDLQKLQAEFARLRDAVARTSAPVGSIVPFVGDPHTLPPEWQLCDGNPLKDAKSPLKDVFKDGKVPNLAARFIRGTVDANSLLAADGKESFDASHAHDVDIDTEYTGRVDNKVLGGDHDPRKHTAYVTHFLVNCAEHPGDYARPKTKGTTASKSLVVPTVPPYYSTYYIIRIK
jgi:hypothetical protein